MSRATLNPAEQLLARHLADARHAANRAAGVPDRKVGPQGAYETDLEGAAAELVVCKTLNVYPDTSVGHRPDFDLLVREGPRSYGVDVKATRYEWGRLLAVPGKAGKPPHAYALVVGKFPSYRLAGFAPAALLLQRKNLTDLGHGPCFAMDQRSLLTWRATLDILNEIPN